MGMNPTSRRFRFIVLFFNCMLTFGSYFCFDMPSTLKDRFQQPESISKYNPTQHWPDAQHSWAALGWTNVSGANHTRAGCEAHCDSVGDDVCKQFAYAPAVVPDDESSTPYSTEPLRQSCAEKLCWVTNGSAAGNSTNPWQKCSSPSSMMAYNEIDYCGPVSAAHKAEVHLTSFEYESFYASYSWTNAVMSVFAGILVDKLGNHLALMLFSLNCVVGSALFALGAMIGSYPLMLVGRIIFGLGNGSLTIVQNKITAFWFKGHELALAFGFTMSLSRLGSVLNFNLSPTFADQYGLVWTLWAGCGLTLIGFVSALTVSWLDKSGAEQIAAGHKLKDTEAGIVEDRTPMKISDIFKYPATFWFLLFSLCFFYNGIFPFMAEAPDFIRMKYSKSSAMAGIIAGLCYDMSMVLSPFLGGIIDKIGRRGKLIIFCGVASFPTFYMLGFTDITPFAPVVLLGFTYSLAASALWPSIALLVPMKSTGLAYGVTNFLQMVSIGICNFIIASLRDGVPSCPECKTRDDSANCHENLKSWHKVMVFMLINVGLCEDAFVMPLQSTPLDTLKAGFSTVNIYSSYGSLLYCEQYKAA
jgi:MFS family permease